MTDLLPFYKENTIEAGCDEAGRGCLAGPVFAAAVILPPGFYCPELNDSKKMSNKRRYTVRKIIEEKALAYGVALVNNKDIDTINILNASFRAMNLAIEKLKLQPQHLLIDGNRFKNQTDIPYTCIVKGDSKYMAIAAASVLAKTYRDDYMLAISKEFPGYGWPENKGYPTAIHIEALRELGPSPYHRKSFHLKSDQLSLPF